MRSARIALTLLLAQLRDRPRSLAVTIAAIALGVALAAGVYLVNDSALEEFSRATRRLSGAADLIIRGGRDGFDERLYARLAARADVAAASPALELEVALGSGGTLKVLGVDPLVAAALQPALYAELAAQFFALTDPNAIALSAAAAGALGLKPGERLEVEVGGRRLPLKVAALLPASAYPGQLGIMDIGSAQWTLGRLGVLNRIDLALAPGADAAQVAQALTAALPPGAILTTAALEVGRGASLTRAYRVNLEMLALVALLTGAFLVFATQSLATLRRRPQHALMRALGVRQAELGAAVLLEGALVGLLGGLLGAAAGAVLAALALALVGGDLGVGVLAGAAIHLHATSGVVGAAVAVGTVVAVLGAWLPAHAAARVPVAQALKAGDAPLALPGRGGLYPAAALLALGAALAWLPPLAGLPLGGYAAIALLLAGALLLLPAFAAALLARLAGPRRPLWRLALAELAGTVSQSALSLAAIVVSFSLMVAMLIMVHSFRDSFERWLGTVLPAEVYLRLPFGNDTAYWSEAQQAAVAALPGVARVEFRRATAVTLSAARPPLMLIARPLGDAAELHLPLLAAAAALPPGLPVVYVSEAIADLDGVRPGQVWTLPVGGELRRVAVAGIYRDYARSTGTVMLERRDYVAWTADHGATEGGLWLEPGVAARVVIAGVRRLLGGGESVQILEAATLKQRSLAIFDRAFAITYALEAIAVLIGLVGVSLALASQALARRAEFGMLRHLGLRRRDVAALLALEGALLGVLGATAGLATGLGLSAVLVKVVNRQSFHWSLDFVVPIAPLALAALALTLAATLTASFGARVATGGAVIRAVREDW